MKVVIDWRTIFDPRGGLHRAFQATLPRLARDHGVEVGFLQRAYNNPVPAVSKTFPIALPVPFRFLPEGAVKEWAWGERLKKIGPALFHSPYYSESPCSRLTSVVTFYDLILEIFAQNNRGELFDKLRDRKRRLASSAKRIIAISQSTASDLTRVFQVSPDRIDVIPLGVDHAFLSQPVTPPDNKGEPYLLVVGGREAHKNFFSFLDAYANSGLRTDFQVIAAGEPWNPAEKAKIQSLGLEKQIRNRVWPDDTELRALYQGCATLVYPSTYEGFGLPPLEAMAAGAPVALSRVSSLPEVAGEAGFYFDPKNLTEMAQIIARAAFAGRSAPQVKAGQDRARQFTWDETTRLTFQTYQKALISG